MVTFPPSLSPLSLFLSLLPSLCSLPYPSKRRLLPYLSSPFDSLPDAEVTEDPSQEESQGQLPADGAWVINAFGNLQSPFSVEKNVQGLDRAILGGYREKDDSCYMKDSLLFMTRQTFVFYSRRNVF